MGIISYGSKRKSQDRGVSTLKGIEARDPKGVEHH
jgi:hypothetical protein